MSKMSKNLVDNIYQGCTTHGPRAGYSTECVIYGPRSRL